MSPPLKVARTNTILYCEHWVETVDFYRNTLGLPATHTIDWFLEVHLGDTAHLSLADAEHTTIDPGRGAGITLSWQVEDVVATHAALSDLGMTVSDIATRWDTNFFEFHDPEGNRIELWSPTP